MAKFRFSLVPHDERFLDMFKQACENVLAGAREFHDLLENYSDVDRKVGRLKEIEHRGDEITHAIFDALNRSFVTPFDRDDVSGLASALDDVIDWIEEAALRMRVYKITESTDLARRFARVLVSQAESICRAVPLLENAKTLKGIREQIVEIHRLENEADGLMIQALGGLYTGVSEVPALVLAVKWSDIYHILEDATDKAEHVGIALESIVVKQS